MAATIVSTPALGASDWSGWITQQGLTDRGFMRLSLTNFAGTAASTVAAGSILECAGSIYSFTDTAITLAAATASAAVAVYFVAIPSAGGTTCTIQMDSTAPTWIDAKQGFYASAASVSRVFGGCYIGTAATYYSKFLYTGENLNYCLQTGATRPLLRYSTVIGDWNMDTTVSVVVPFGCSAYWQRVRSTTAIIRDDADAEYVNLLGYVVGDVPQGGVSDITSAGLKVWRKSAGTFDDVDHDATSYNRGWVTFMYEA